MKSFYESWHIDINHREWKHGSTPKRKALHSKFRPLATQEPGLGVAGINLVLTFTREEDDKVFKVALTPKDAQFLYLQLQKLM